MLKMLALLPDTTTPPVLAPKAIVRVLLLLLAKDTQFNS
jgi:hypothetical protein